MSFDLPPPWLPDQRTVKSYSGTPLPRVRRYLGLTLRFPGSAYGPSSWKLIGHRFLHISTYSGQQCVLSFDLPPPWLSDQRTVESYSGTPLPRVRRYLGLALRLPGSAYGPSSWKLIGHRFLHISTVGSGPKLELLSTPPAPLWI